jgi:hypothetical protein
VQGLPALQIVFAVTILLVLRRLLLGFRRSIQSLPSDRILKSEFCATLVRIGFRISVCHGQSFAKTLLLIL